MNNRNIDEKPTSQVVIDRYWRDILAHMRVEQHRSIRSLIEAALAESYSDYQVGSSSTE